MGAHEKRFLAAAFPPRSIRTVVLSFLGTCLFFSFSSLMRMPKASYYPHYIYDHIATYFEPGVYNNTLYQNGTEQAVHPQFNFSQPCDGFPSTKDVMVVMKTGATESFEKMPTQLLTGLQCVPDFLLFSDLEQQIGKYHIYNVLEGVEDLLNGDRDEFRLYQAMQDCPVSQIECTKGMPGGWDLDKYKFLSMVLRTWEMRPDRKWYLFVEADTYTFFSNVVEWLNNHMDESKDLYVGGIAYLGDLPFAHGGTGYVISGVLMQKLYDYINQLPPAELIRMAENICCGDSLLADAITKVNVSVQKASPMFNGERLNTLVFSPREWCQPLFTLHHMNSEEISAVWQYEQTRTKTEPLQIHDIYEALIAPNMEPRRPHWNNLAEQHCFSDGQGKNIIEKQAHESATACARVCVAEGLNIDEATYKALETDEDRDLYLQHRYRRQSMPARAAKRQCFQWRYKEGKCCVSDSWRMGYPVKSRDEDDATSGWFLEGIHDWIQADGQCTKGTQWVTPECVGKHCSKAKDTSADEKKDAEQKKAKEEAERKKKQKEEKKVVEVDDSDENTLITDDADADDLR